MGTCKGKNVDGADCKNRVKEGQDYCWRHPDQAPDAGHDGEGRWTRERLEAAIEANGGPEGLDIAGADLSELDLSGMDLHGVDFFDIDKECGVYVITNLRGTDLSYTDLHRTNLTCANLQGSKLTMVNLKETFLNQANLQEAELYSAELHRAILDNANMREAVLWSADLENAHFREANLYRANLMRADLQGAYLLGASLQEADLRHANLKETNLLDVKMGGLDKIKLYRAKLDRTLLKKEQLAPRIGDEAVGKYLEARDAYLSLKQNFESLGDYDAASWAYIKERKMEMKCSWPGYARQFYGREELGDTDEQKLPVHHPKIWWFYFKHLMKWLGDGLVWLISGFGERPWHTVATMATVFALFVFTYWCTGAVVKVGQELSVIQSGSGGTVAQLVTTREVTNDLVDLAVFGLGAFTTMDPSGLEPRAAWVQLLTGLEALLGIGLTGLLGFVIGNRIRRS